MDAAPSVWLRPARGARGPVSQWSRSDVARAAVLLADGNDAGLDAVTMRAVAHELGTAPASLYRVVESRSHLLELMVDDVIAEFDLRSVRAGSGAQGLLRLSRQARRIYRAHPWMLTLPAQAPVLGPNAIDYLECALAVLTGLRLTGREKLEAIGILSGLVRILVQDEVQQVHAGRLSTEWQDAMTSHLRVHASAAEHPHLAEVLADQRDRTRRQSFDEVVLRALDGLLAPH